MNTTSKSGPSFGWQHALVIVLGLLVFVLLLLADNTNLKGEEDEIVAGERTEARSTSGEGLGEKALALRALLPPSQPTEEIKQLETQLQETSGPVERSGLLQQIVTGYREAGQYDQAAIFAGVLADNDPSLRNLVVAGALFRNANTLPALQADTAVYHRFSDESIAYLELAQQMDPGAEDAKIELGLAYIESRQPGRSMQGISKLVEVVDSNPNNTEALMYLGGFSMDTGQYDKAEKRYRQVLEANPDNLQGKYMLAVALDAQGKSAESRQLMTEVAEQELDPELAAAAKSALK